MFLGLLEELERGGDLEDLHGLDERLAALYALPDLDAPETLQVMTIHKSKGLEFDTVIVAGLGRGGGLDEPQLLQWLERPGSDGRDELLLAAITEKGRDKDPIYDCVKRLNGERERQEEGRLLYVAVTRARKRVHLVGATQVEEDTGEIKPPPADSLLARLWPALAHEFEAAARRLPAHNVISPAASSNVQPTAQRIRRLPAGWTLPTAPESVPWRMPPALQDRELPEIEFSWAGEIARHVGTVVHRWLQRMADDGLAGWDAKRVRALRKAFENELVADGLTAGAVAGAAERVTAILERTLANERGRRLLGPHEDAQSEVKLTGVGKDGIVNVVVDRTFVDESGTRWIVDYKTSTHEGADVDAFLDREQERYSGQLEQYAALMREMDSRPIRLGLYFPLLVAGASGKCRALAARPEPRPRDARSQELFRSVTSPTPRCRLCSETPLALCVRSTRQRVRAASAWRLLQGGAHPRSGIFAPACCAGRRRGTDDDSSPSSPRIRPRLTPAR